MNRHFLRDNGLFLLLFVVVFAALGIAIATIDKQALHLMMNTWHCSSADIFFKYYTSIADYLTFAVAIILLFYKVGDSLFVLSAYLGSGLITQIAKRIVQAPRPSIVFDIANYPDALPLVEGVRLHTSNSFPSGHTTAFFAVFFAIAIVLTMRSRQSAAVKGLYQALCFLLATLGAWSRIYLSQHFAADVFAGGIIAVLSVCLIYYGFALLQEKHPLFYSWNLSAILKKKK